MNQSQSEPTDRIRHTLLELDEGVWKLNIRGLKLMCILKRKKDLQWTEIIRFHSSQSDSINIYNNHTKHPSGF